MSIQPLAAIHNKPYKKKELGANREPVYDFLLVE